MYSALNHYLLDLWRRRAAADEWVEAFCDLVLTWWPIGWAEEQGQIRSGVGPFLARRMREGAGARARRQGGARTIDARPHGAGRALCAGARTIGERSDAVLRTAMARRLPRRTPELPRRPPRRPGRCHRSGRATASADGGAGEAAAVDPARARQVGQAVCGAG